MLNNYVISTSDFILYPLIITIPATLQFGKPSVSCFTCRITGQFSYYNCFFMVTINHI